MRKLKDKCGYEISISSISGRDDFDGLIEGDPILVRKMRLSRAKRDIDQNKGVFYWGMDDLEKEIENLDRETDIWPSRENWVANVGNSAYLGCHNDMYKYENKNLMIQWYQEGEDPMESLKTIVSKIDFLSLCKTEITEEYD